MQTPANEQWNFSPGRTSVIASGIAKARNFMNNSLFLLYLLDQGEVQYFGLNIRTDRGKLEFYHEY